MLTVSTGLGVAVGDGVGVRVGVDVPCGGGGGSVGVDVGVRVGVRVEVGVPGGGGGAPLVLREILSEGLAPPTIRAMSALLSTFKSPETITMPPTLDSGGGTR